MITAKIIKDSKNPWGKRLTTFVLTYPRFIHSEFMTHRMFSRNASSSRAIPVGKQILSALSDEVWPLCFTANKKGMQGGPELPPDTIDEIVKEWDAARSDAVCHARRLADLGLHKQYVSRIIEPFLHISVVCSATDFDNFFALRRHPDAQPEIHKLADVMFEALKNSEPVMRSVGQWHLPFVDEEYEYETPVQAVRRSVACCARVSYRNHDKTQTTDEQDAELYDRLLNRNPKHCSPAEHQAIVSDNPTVVSGNFSGGWVQYRKTLPNENITCQL
jgi:thymidylate synthase ThyX